MANRAKREAILQENLQNEYLYQQLFRESRYREADRRRYREVEREENRQFLRLIRRGIPSWVATQPDLVDFLALVTRYAPFWVRKFKPWPFPESDTRNLEQKIVNYLFVRYPVSDKLYQGWANRDETLIRWFIHLAQGGNIRKAPDLPFPLTKKMAHLALQAPADLTFVQSLRFGQVLGLGGSEDLALILLNSRMDLDPTKQDFWLEVIHWLVQNEPIKPDLIQMIVAYLYSRKFRRSRIREQGKLITSGAPEPDLSMKGRSLQKVTEQAIEWHWLTTVMNGMEDNRITSRVGDMVFMTGGGDYPRIRYEIRPLLTEDEIFEEGRAMSHCVGTYANAVKYSQTSIWSLTSQEKGSVRRRLLTIELGKNLEILQVRGKANRLPTSFESSLVQRWVSQQQLMWDRDVDRW